MIKVRFPNWKERDPVFHSKTERMQPILNLDAISGRGDALTTIAPQRLS
jgi:hypothetical protein